MRCSDSSTFQRSRTDSTTTTVILRRLYQTGERKRMVDNLRANLLSCGWNDEVIGLCKDSIQSKQGLENVNLEEMVSDILDHAKALVPDEVKWTFLRELQELIDQDPELCHQLLLLQRNRTGTNVCIR